MIGDKFYHFLTSLVQGTNPSVTRVLRLNNIMHQKVQCVNQTAWPKYVGILILNDCYQCYKYRRYIGNITIYRDVNSPTIYQQYIAPIFSWFFLAIFPDFLAIFADFITIFADFWRYLPIFSNILWFFSFFVFFILPIYCRCLATFLPINPIISFWTLGDIFADTIFVTLL